jgi:alpha-amylase
MQQKMLEVSRSLRALRGHPAAAKVQAGQEMVGQAEQRLYAGQCNCAYWHGVFGGLYLGHLRRAVYANLIEAEQLAQQARGAAPSIEALDSDADGREELRIRNRVMSLVVDPFEGGAVTEWSLYGPRLNLLDTLSRRYEPYHETLRGKSLSAVGAEGVPASIHDTLGVKQQDLAASLAYDDHRRSAFLDYGLQAMPTLTEVTRSAWGERRLWSCGPYRTEPSPRDPGAQGDLSVSMIRRLAEGRLRKTIRAAADGPTLECLYHVEGVRAPVVALEFNFSLRDARYLTEAGTHPALSEFSLEESSAGVAVHASIEPAALLMHFPIETVSESEGGLERTYQGMCVMCFWSLEGAPSWTGRVQWTIAS